MSILSPPRLVVPGAQSNRRSAVSLPDPRYRADIDGLRAVAILLVVGFHAFPEWIPAGFIGVDIFFVISGFLITSIIVDGLQHKQFGFAAFYARRARRIFPALLLVLALCFIAGWYLLLTDEFTALARHIAAGAGFVSNLQLWSESGYFDRAAESKPLQHLWSLGIEEQFYILWPLALYLVYRCGIPFIVLFASITGFSFLANIALIGHDPVEVFYSPVTRVWELSTGGLLAIVMRDAGQTRRTIAAFPLLRADFFALSGIALIAIALAELNQIKPFPGWWAIVPVGGATLLIAAGPMATLNRHLLANRLAIGIGLISYPLYLWHWPLLTFLRLVSPHSIGALPRLAAIGAAVLAAIATYYLVESPLRRGKISFFRTAILFVLVAGLGLFGFAASELLWPSRHADRGLTRIVNAMHDWAYPPIGFRGFYHDALRFYRKDLALASVTLFVGDSNMEQYAPRIDSRISQQPQSANSAIFATRGGCLPIPRFYDSAEWLCRAKMRSAFDLATDPRIDTIVLGAVWASVASRNSSAELVNSLQNLLAYWSSKKRVFVVLAMPGGPEFDPQSMFEGSRLGELRPRRRIAQVALSEVLSKQAFTRALLINAAQAYGAIVIDPLPDLCPHDLCPTQTADGDPLYLDGAHMRPAYVIRNATYIDQTLRPLMRGVVAPDGSRIPSVQ